MKKCLSCGSDFPDDRIFCPECGEKLVEISPPPPLAPAPARQSRWGTVILAIIAVGAVVTAVFLGIQVINYSERLGYAQQTLNNTRNELTQTKDELENAQAELEKLGGLQNLYGYGSENYYAEESVVILQVGETAKATIYGEYVGTCTCSSSASGIICEWDSEWSEHRIQLNITGTSKGVYTVSFTNDQNSDSFEILVIVTE